MFQLVAGVVANGMYVRSSDSVDLPLWTPPPVKEEELTRLEEAFKRWASNTGYLPQVTFQKDVLTDVVPQKLSEVSLFAPSCTCAL